MKYIRTKDRIYEVTYWNKDECGYYTYENISFCEPRKYIFNEDIIKQADTIEKLRDRYVLSGVDTIYLNKDKTQYHFENEDTWYDITETELRKGIYGAIWTDKSLIYVAKMNDKGELELL